MEVLRDLEAQPYAKPVGRIIFQKICCVMTEMGHPTDSEFGKGDYGPFSGHVKQALHDFANCNWLQEQPLGRMLALRVHAQHSEDRKKFAARVEQHQKRIHKAVDLFSRIKNTEQAEKVLAVANAIRNLVPLGWVRVKASESMLETG
jgi:uncharacterized protein YwgA